MPFTLVPEGCFKGVGLRLRPDLQPRHLPAGLKSALNSVDNVSPRLGIPWRSAMGRKPLFQEGLLPLLKRHLVRARRDPVPQRLHVLDLVLDEQGVKSWRRQGQRMWHVPDYTTRPGVASIGTSHKIGVWISSAQRPV